MTHPHALRWIPAACLLLAACSATHTGEDSGDPFDGGGSDAAREDSGRPDAARPDAARPDAARPDAGECGDPTPGPSRPAAWDCSPCRPPGPSGITDGDCTTDAECTAGDNGRCGYSRIGGMCSYDVCFSDADCAAGELCACDGGNGGGNACIEAGCHTDADCGAFACSPSLGSCGHYFPPVGYYCHAAGDDCFSDDECGGAYCAYDPTTRRWACSMAECVG